MTGKWRNRLRRAQQGKVQVVEERFDPRRHAALLDRETAQGRARGYRSYPAAFLAAYATANPDATMFLRAQLKGETCAFMIFFQHGACATYIAGWSGPQGRAAQAHTLLLWTAMDRLSARGYLRLDLGPVDTDRTPGLTRFKLGAGAIPRRLGPTLLILPGRSV
ncbi:GNAT family N-acetyltransferase [Pseudooceanicola sp. C21-150M6]